MSNVKNPTETVYCWLGSAVENSKKEMKEASAFIEADLHINCGTEHNEQSINLIVNDIEKFFNIKSELVNE